MSEPEGNKPEYGQYQQPAYGAMSGQYGPNYNPYIYGAPEPDASNGAEAGNTNTGNAPYAGQSNGRQPGDSQPNGQSPYGRPYGMQNGAGPNGSQPNGQFRQPRYYNGINLDDPNQNPLYGHWDSYAIIAFLLAVFFPVPVLSALMGGVAMWRTRTFHMKGFGLALAAVIINVLYTLAVLWMMLNGYDAMTLYQEALQQLTGGGSGSSSDSISA